MGTINFIHKFDIGDKVFHATPDGDCGIVIDVSYSFRSGVRYEVVFGRRGTDNVWCVEEELSDSKVF